MTITITVPGQPRPILVQEQVLATRGPQGDVGPAGPTGPRGVQGDPGSNEWGDIIGKPTISQEFETLDDLVASDNLTVGDHVKTLGYAAAGDGGGAVYEIVAAATGTDDGGSYIDLTGITGQAKLLHNGTIAAEQFGAVHGVESSAQLQAAWDALMAWRTANPSVLASCMTHSSTVTIQNRVDIYGDGGGAAENSCNFDFTDAHWTAVSGGDLADDNPMLLVRCPRAVQHHGTYDCGKFSAGITFNGSAGARIHEPAVTNFKGWGITVTGSAGGMAMYSPRLSEYNQSDDEYTTQANFTATAFVVATGDFNVYNANILFNNIGIYLESDAVQVHFVEPHIVMGNAVEGSGNPFVNGILVENHATRENHFDQPYFDNGVVDDYGGTMNINGGHYVHNGAATITEPKIRIYPTSAGQDLPTELRINNIGGLATVSFVDDGANTWTGDWSSLSAQFINMAEEDRQVSYRQTQFDIWPNNAANIIYNYKPDGNFLTNYASGSDTIGFQVLPGDGEVRLNGTTDAAPDNANTVILRKTGDTRYLMGKYTRSDLVTWAGMFPHEQGDVVHCEDVSYQFDDTTTAITDLTGWTYFGDLSPDHFATKLTADWETAILAALHFYGSSGGSGVSSAHTVHLLDHAYPTSNLAGIRDGVGMVGKSRQASVIELLEAAGDGISFGDESSLFHNVDLRNFSITMATGVEKTSGAHIYIPRCKEANIANIDIQKFYSGIKFFGGERVVIEGCRGSNATGDRVNPAANFIHLAHNDTDNEDPADVKIIGCRANTGGSGMGDDGLLIESADGAHVIGCNFNQFDHAVHITTDNAYNIGGVIMTSNYFDQSGVNNLLIDGGGTLQNSQFNSNLYRVAGEDAIKVDASTTLTNVQFFGGHIHNPQERAFNWNSTDSTGISVKGMKIAGPCQDGTTTAVFRFASDILHATGNDISGGWSGATVFDLNGDGLSVLNNDLTQSDCGTEADGNFTDGANFAFFTLADDTLFEMKPPRKGGFATVTAYNGAGVHQTDESCRVRYNTNNATLGIELLTAAYTGEGDEVEVSTSDLDETTATDVKMTIVVQDDVFRIINRTGAKQLYAITYS